MNEDRQMELHYMDTGFPYTNTESFMDFFQGLHQHQVPAYGNAVPLLDQGNAYWSMNMQCYKFGVSDHGNTYYGHSEESHHLPPSMDVGEREWEYPTSAVNVEIPEPSYAPSVEEDVVDAHSIPEECDLSHREETSTSQVTWQDEIDPDHMTYEELLDLGESVGTESRGLSEEQISLLPTARCKLTSFFSRKKLDERCVICQMRYKRGDKQIKLPCKHFYHNKCITKWLTINKICPICNIEVFGDGSTNASASDN
ncbi:E3 ubiquitin-protein ligase BIG BROTHER [Cucumis melo]|uniref:E3 ubiquitin ligase BIG BROTHER isoform X1 n=1 Tax=Cucumis melo TaxID=3656 RepID=A0A1S3CED1_CUCME|nr:E3 ubiquitin-protein ligase BIG BROTHER [Cucumis melo]XP_008461283.1 E3 ubiquitin-protein ligase BIG BROTHER [Cucumis melo]XP_050944233.1 E3 ubiquitin-protein ligase BIG BROTHER [Cucumis melo]